MPIIISGISKQKNTFTQLLSINLEDVLSFNCSKKKPHLIVSEC